MNNPYTPPSAKIEEMENAPGSPVKGVFYGVLVDMGGSILTGIAIVVAYTFSFMSSGASEQAFAERMAQLENDTTIFIVGSVIGCLWSVLGGYICARTARRSEYKTGNVMAAITISLGLLMGSSSHSLPVQILMYVATWASIMLGVWLAVRRARPALATEVA